MRSIETTGSSTVHFVAYDERRRRMYVKYRSGDKIYSTENVSEATFAAIVDSSSTGSALAKYFKSLKEQGVTQASKLTTEESERILAVMHSTKNTLAMAEAALSAVQQGSAWF